MYWYLDGVAMIFFLAAFYFAYHNFTVKQKAASLLWPYLMLGFALFFFMCFVGFVGGTVAEYQMKAELIRNNVRIAIAIFFFVSAYLTTKTVPLM